MTGQPGKQTIAMNILPKISRSKSNQTIKFGQLIEWHEKQKNHTQNVLGKLFLFSKISKLNTSLDQ